MNNKKIASNLLNFNLKKKIIYLCTFVILFLGCKHWIFLQIDYSKLEEMLSQGKWQEADIETSQIIKKNFGKSVDDITFFGYSAIPGFQLITSHAWRIAVGAEKGFSCEPLLKMDKLWMKYSHGYFGFSVQAALAESIENDPKYKSIPVTKTYERFETLKDKLGWRLIPNNPNFYLYAQNPKESKGFLPSYLWVSEINLPKPTSSPTLVMLRKFRKCENPGITK